MKRFIGKHIALFLSLALIIGTIVPVISGNFASAETTEADDIAAVKAAWGKIQSPIGAIFGASAYRYDGGTDQASPFAALKRGTTHPDAVIYTEISETDPDYTRLGTYKATYDITDGKNKTEVGDSNKYTVFFSPTDDLNTSTYKFTAGAGNAYVAFKVETLNAAGKLGFHFINGGTIYKPTYTIDIDATKVGQWIMLPLDEIWNTVTNKPNDDSFIEYFTANVFNRFEAIPIQGLDASVTFGSVMSSAKILPLDSLTSGWGVAEWVDAAQDLDTTGCFFTEELDALLNGENGLSDKYADAIALSGLKLAWTNMATRKSILYPSAEKVNNAGAAVLPAADRFVTADGNLPYGATADMLGTNYASYHNSYDGNYSNATSNVISSRERFLIYGQPGNKSLAKIPLADIDEFYFNMYIEDVKAPGQMITAIINQTSSSIFIKGGIAVDESMEGQWITIKDTDLYTDGVKGMASAYEALGISQDLSALMINLDGGLICKAYVGSVVKLNHLTLPENSDGWTATQWILAAEELDTTGNTNVENFEAKLLALKQQSGSEYAIEKLKTSWTSLSATAKTIYTPVSYRATGVSADDVVGTMDADVAPETFGFGSYTYDIEAVSGVKAPTASNKHVIFVTEKATELTPNYKFDVEDMAIKFRVNSVTNPGKIGFKIVGAQSKTFLSSYTIDVNADTKGTWQTVLASYIYKNITWQNLTDEALTDFNNGMSFSDFFKNYVLSRIEIVPLCDDANVPTKANISITPLMSTTALTIPTKLGDASFSELLAAAEHLDTSTCVNTEQFAATIEELKEYAHPAEYAFATEKYDVFNGITERTTFVPSEIMAQDSSLAFGIEPFAPADIVAPLDYQNDFGGYVADYSKTADGLAENGIVCAATDNSFIDIDKVDDIYFYYKSDKDFNLRLVDSYGEYTTDAAINKTVASATTWTKCSLSTLIGANWKNELKGNSAYSQYTQHINSDSTFKLSNIQLVFAGKANCQVGAVIGEKAFSAFDFLDFVTSKDYATVITKGYAIDSANFGHARDFRDRLAAIVNTKGTTNDATLGCVNADYVNGYSIKDLVCLNNYIADTSIVIDKKAADIDKNSTIDASDFTALRDLVFFLNVTINPSKKLNILCMGDSLTEGDFGAEYKPRVQSQNYPYYLAKELNANTANMGKCGYNATSYLAYYDENRANRDISNTDVIIIMLGTNGGLAANGSLQGNADYISLINECKEDAPNAEIVLCTPPKVGAPSTGANSVNSATAFIKGLEYLGVSIIDVNARPYDAAEHASDGCHFNAAGYEALAKYIAERL